MSDSTPPTDAGRAYIERIEGLVGTRDPLEILSHTVQWLGDIVILHDELTLRKREPPDRWSIAEVIHHLADTELVYGYRLRLMLTVDAPVFERFDQEAWADTLSYDWMVEEALGRLSVLRAAHLRLLLRLSRAQRARSGVHTSRGTETVAQLIVRWAGHDLAHQQQIERIRAAVS